MNNQELNDVLIKELGIGGLPKEAQEEIVSKFGEIILKSITVAIFEKLSDEARAEFERVGAEGDPALIQKFMEEHVPDLSELMAKEVKGVLQSFTKTDKI